jgi:PIN domain nuclease of toxin-antitoxin system
MRALLDTHTLLWWLSDNPTPSSAVRDLIADPTNEIYVSPASVWEIANKYAKGKLPSAEAIVHDLPSIISQEDFRHLLITSQHMVKSVFLASDHKDPFDRILAAQAIVEDMPICSVDPMLSALGATSLW